MAHGHHHAHGGHGEHGHGHGHGHHHDEADWDALAPALEAQAELLEPLYRDAFAWIAQSMESAGPAGSAAGERAEPRLVVDAGSGPGVVACFLADTFPGARVVAADGSPELLRRASDRAERLGLAGRFTTLAGELPDSLTDLDGQADLFWASQSLHHLGDQRAALAALAEHLAPGGTLALLEGGLQPRFLPRDIGLGRPGLQARLEAAEQDRFAAMRADLPDTVAVTEDWPGLLASAGLEHTGTRSFLFDAPPPVDEKARAYAVSWTERRREAADDLLDAEDRAVLDRLLDPEDPAGLHRRPDVFVLLAHTVHVARKPR